MRSQITRSEAETEAFAASLAKLLQPSDVVALFGEMGSGKTAFVRGLAAGLGIRDRVSSPTFSLVHRYRGKICLSHYDFDRMTDPYELEDSGFYLAIEQGDILVCEWSERIESALPEKAVRVKITLQPDQSRLFEVFDPANRV